MTTTSSAGPAAGLVEARRTRLEALLQIASRQFDLRLAFGEADRVGGGRIAMRLEASEAEAATYLALKGGALHLLGHHLPKSEGALAAAIAEEAGGKTHFVALWHALEDARIENAMLGRWPGMGRAFEARLRPSREGSLVRLAPLPQQIELGLYSMGRGLGAEHFKEAVRVALLQAVPEIAKGAHAEDPEGSLAAMRTIYPHVATLLRGTQRRRQLKTKEDPGARPGPEGRLDGSPDRGREEGGLPEIELREDLATAGLLGQSRELPEWYRPGSAPWFERGLGEKKVHPSVLRSEAQTIVRPPHGDLPAYASLWREVQREVGQLETRLTNLLREEAYLRFGGQFRSGKMHTAKLWKQRLGIYRLFERPVHGGKSTAFSLLIDESASMKGQEKYRLAAKTAILLGETLARLDVPLEIISYTTGDFEARAAMRLGLTPAHEYRTMRCSPLEHRIYKAFHEPYRAVRARLSEIQPRHNNWDEESVVFSARRLFARPEPAKILLVISDGQPNGDAEHLIRAVADVERSGCRVIGLGIGADFVRQIYRNAIVVEGFRQMGEELLRLLAREIVAGSPAIGGWRGAPGRRSEPAHASGVAGPGLGAAR